MSLDLCTILPLSLSTLTLYVGVGEYLQCFYAYVFCKYNVYSRYLCKCICPEPVHSHTSLCPRILVNPVLPFDFEHATRVIDYFIETAQGQAGAWQNHVQ